MENLVGAAKKHIFSQGESGRSSTFSDSLFTYMQSLGFSTCFFLAGGNSMHLLESASKHFRCIPTSHEVSAVIASEYYNTCSKDLSFALVTAGPGLTNCVTAIAGAWLESRFVLVIGGQVKTSNLRPERMRQYGIQEIDGVGLVETISKKALRIMPETSPELITEAIDLGRTGRKGPVFLEIPINVSANVADINFVSSPLLEREAKELSAPQLNQINVRLAKSNRPLFLFGQGITKESARSLNQALSRCKIPVATTWTGADRVGFDSQNYIGRPNYYGMRISNLVIQKTDLIVALGAGLGLQQIGFNTRAFAPNAEIIQVDIDSSQFEGPLSSRVIGLDADANSAALQLIPLLANMEEKYEWFQHCMDLRTAFPTLEERPKAKPPFLDPYKFIHDISLSLSESQTVISCSSGGTFTAFMQVFENKTGQTIISNKGLASMGYGLAGAVGASIAKQQEPIILFEGDGGFLQNCQELGTVVQNNLNLKMFIFDNSGYASIRSSQKTYFGGNYLGCDIETGLGLPNWQALAGAFGVKHLLINYQTTMQQVMKELNHPNPVLFQVLIDPEALYLPKIASRVMPSGEMLSNPLHIMNPEIEVEKMLLASKFLYEENSN